MVAVAAPSRTGIRLSPEELEELTRYTRAGDQLAELHRQGFYRARRDRLGQVVLERAHYEAVCGRAGAANDPEDEPTPRLLPP
jgi:hypothetical protein